MKSIQKTALLNSLTTFAYVVLLATFMTYNKENKWEGEGNIFVPVAMMMLFMFSAALTGSLVFGRPILWYLDGKKKEAVSLLIYTLGILFVLAVIMLTIVITFFSH